MNRDELIQMRNTAMVELANARGLGYSDEDILEALRSGNKKQQLYADFIEKEIMKGENCVLPENYKPKRSHMKACIGTKIVLAELMSKEEFDFRKSNLLNLEFGERIELPEFAANTEGYHVIYPNTGGEYHSWSPKDVFEKCYRDITLAEKEMVNF